MMDHERVASAFVEQYYSLFDGGSREGLGCIYGESSLMTFEGQEFVGGDNIALKLASLPFPSSSHTISTLDSQPSGTDTGGILVFVSGSLTLPAEDHPLRFTQMFHLMPTSQGCFYVANDIFRLNYG